LGLPSPREEHSAGLDGELDRPGGCPDESALLGAASLDQLPWDAHRRARCESDAWAGARRDAAADATHPDLPGAGAGKSADQEQDARAQAGSPSGDLRSAVLA